jgi:hypothetical protein
VTRKEEIFEMLAAPVGIFDHIGRWSANWTIAVCFASYPSLKLLDVVSPSKACRLAPRLGGEVAGSIAGSNLPIQGYEVHP